MCISDFNPRKELKSGTADQPTRPHTHQLCVPQSPFLVDPKLLKLF